MPDATPKIKPIFLGDYTPPTREGALSLLKNTFGNQNGYNAKHVVLLMWRGPISNCLNSRSGGFSDYNEAKEFADGLAQKYTEMNLPFAVYVNGSIYKSKDEGKIIDEQGQ